MFVNRHGCFDGVKWYANVSTNEVIDTVKRDLTEDDDVEEMVIRELESCIELDEYASKEHIIKGELWDVLDYICDSLS